jgi:dynein heavy chain
MVDDSTFPVIVIHWTRQIKELVNNQESLESTDTSGPLQEIEFWKTRCEDLSGLNKQLSQPGVASVTNILEKAKSSYLDPFIKLAQLIQNSHYKAENCLNFLSTLHGPCTELANAQPKDIQSLLPRLINLMRVIWVHCDHYHNKDRLTTLLRKVSSDIIARCRAKIVLEEIFNGQTENSRISLLECIDCCKAWKDIYEHMTKVHSHFSEGWILDESSIFAQVDAFIQRCRDLLDVVAGQEHFARFSQGVKRPIPLFSGCKGPEIARSLKEIEHSFEKLMNSLHTIFNVMLDVKATLWHDEYNKYRSGVKDLEVMLQNIINTSFSSITTIQEGVELLDVFTELTSREVCFS